MAAFLENLWQIILMLILLAFSGFLSGSETAFFNLSRRQIEVYSKSSSKIQKLAARLLRRPRKLLTSLLFGNMAVNVLYFAISGVLSINISENLHPSAGAVFAIISFTVLLIFGEMLPKSFAYLHSNRFSLTAAPMCYLCTRIFWPLLRMFEYIIINPAIRLLIGHPASIEHSEPVTGEEFKLLIEASRHHGLINDDENQLFSEVIELGMLKVRQVIRPRVDIVTADISESRDEILKLMNENSMTKIPVYSKDIDNIIGLIYQRDLLLNPDKTNKELVKKVDFVPEQKSVESLLEFFRQNKVDTAIVVDEYGGIAGSVSVEDIVEEILGPIEKDKDTELIEQLGPLEYRLDANLSIHEWSQTFEIDHGQKRLATIGGLAMALLGKIPRPGDVAYLKNIKLTVEKVKKHRIETLLLSLEQVP